MALLAVCALGQNFGNAQESAPQVTVVSTTGVTSTAPLTTSRAATSTDAPVTTTSAGLATTGPIPTFSKAVIREEPVVSLGCPAEPALRAATACQSNVVFAYKDLFAGTGSQYCCPHRDGLAVINGTGSVVASPGTPSQSYERPQAVIGSATLSDSPFSIGLTLSVDPSFLVRGHVVTLTMEWSRGGLQEGSALFASGLVPLSATPLVLSGFYSLPRGGGLNSTIGYDLRFRLNDNGPVTSQVATQWVQPFSAGNALSQYWVSFSARTAFQ